MNLAQLPIDRLQETSITHCNLFISPQFHRLKTPKIYITAELKTKWIKFKTIYELKWWVEIKKNAKKGYVHYVRKKKKTRMQWPLGASTQKYKSYSS